MKGIRKISLAMVLIMILSFSTSISSLAAVKITVNGDQTMVVGFSRRIYVTGAGSRTVKVTSSSSAVSVRKDSKSIIVTGKKPGSAYVTVQVGSIKKRIHFVVLSITQAYVRVTNYLRKYNKNALTADVDSGGPKAIWLWTFPEGKGGNTLDIKLNLETGRAVCYSGWEYSKKIPKSFKIW